MGEGFYTIQDFFDWILRENGLTEFEINRILNTLNSRTVKKLIANEDITSEELTSKITPLNTWFLTFLQGKLLKDSSWKDVEKQIEYYLNNKLLTPTSTTVLPNGYHYVNFTEKISINNVLNVKLFLKHRELLKEFPESNHLDFFLSELYSLEADFEKLVSADSDKNLPYNIMSFNYTDPWNSRWEKNGGLNQNFAKPEKSTNVHGQALKIKDGMSRIIFGIDNQNIKPSDIRYLFTKTFRTLVNYSDDRKPLDSVKENVFDKDISIFKFFGHSLSEADYSYFQQMFDYYNL
ncbi:hypothetical protein GYN67_00825 [Lactococcus piscium]|uniref:AbiH family protein n=1 Tax=Pseudolactococcus carnosus TaxID=2749961 RepID=UPI001FB9BFF8|nr:AbiH family protein [Lactococcus carnosus]MCJ1995234.1 hypothetical protein [Lactococcus carnosus]